MKHILIIDDDIHIGDMLEEVLTREGYRVSRAYSGTEALLAVKAFSPDLVLLDLMLPGLAGEEVLPRIKGIPVIVVSAKIDQQNKVDLIVLNDLNSFFSVTCLKKPIVRIGKIYFKGVYNISFIVAY